MRAQPGTLTRRLRQKARRNRRGSSAERDPESGDLRGGNLWRTVLMMVMTQLSHALPVRGEGLIPMRRRKDRGLCRAMAGLKTLTVTQTGSAETGEEDHHLHPHFPTPSAPLLPLTTSWCVTTPIGHSTDQKLENFSPRTLTLSSAPMSSLHSDG